MKDKKPTPLARDHHRRAACAWSLLFGKMVVDEDGTQVTDGGVLMSNVCIRMLAAELNIGVKRAGDTLLEAVTIFGRNSQRNGAPPEGRILAQWYDQAMPTLDVDEKLAASLLATDSEVLMHDLRLPFESVLVRVPDGLLPGVQSVRVTHLNEVWYLCCERGDTDTWVVAPDILQVLSQGSQMASVFHADKDSSKEALEEWRAGRDVFAGEVDLDTEQQRTLRLSHKLALNAVAMMMHRKDAVESREQYHRPSERRSGPPSRRFYKLTAPVIHDMRPAVRDYIAHGGKSPTVQCVVAGHWKMQRCGPGGAERKRIFIEPYWRGPEDAPIAIRPHVLNQSNQT